MGSRRDTAICPGTNSSRYRIPFRAPLMSIVALDNSVKSRLGRVLDGVASVGTLINIDHHVSNEGYGDLNYVDPTAPATGQIIYEFFKEIGAPLSSDMAVNLFAAISTDTGSFQYPGTDARTFRGGGSSRRRRSGRRDALSKDV